MGAGAGYNVTVRGIELDNRNWKMLSDDYDERYDLHTVQVEIPVKPCVAEYWAAESYYDGIDSEHDMYGDLDSQIDGGTAILQMEVYPEYTDDVLSQEELDEAIGDLLPSELDLTMVYGGGWSHVDLPEEGIVFDDDNGRINLDEGETYDYTTVRCELKCPNITQNINAFFKNPDAYYDEYGIPQYPGEDDDEIVNSRKPIKSSTEGITSDMIADRMEEYFNDGDFDVIVTPINDHPQCPIFQIGFNDVYIDWDIDKFYKDITNITHRFANEVLAIESVHFECVNKNGPLWLLIEVQEPM